MTVVNSLTNPNQSFKGSRYQVVETSFNRPADTTAYAVNDVVSDSTGTAAALYWIGGGGTGQVVGARLTVGGILTVDYDLIICHEEPTNHADNAALALTVADARRVCGVVQFANAGKRNAGAFDVYRPTDPLGTFGWNAVGFATIPNSGLLYGLLVCRTAHTPVLSGNFNIQLFIDRG